MENFKVGDIVRRRIDHQGLPTFEFPQVYKGDVGVITSIEDKVEPGTNTMITVKFFKGVTCLNGDVNLELVEDDK